MELIVRPETEKDYYAAELMTQHAFWNLHRPGCDEHYLVHRLRKDTGYLPEISRVAELDGKIVGMIMYCKATLQKEDKEYPVLTFGPLCVEPEYQKQGIGGKLLEETLALAKEAGHTAVIILGEPDYYPRHGFDRCSRWNIRTADGQNFPAFMGIELQPGSLEGLEEARFIEPNVYLDLPPEEVERFNQCFPFLKKEKLPGQWD